MSTKEMDPPPFGSKPSLRSLASNGVISAGRGNFSSTSSSMASISLDDDAAAIPRAATIGTLGDSRGEIGRNDSAV